MARGPDGLCALEGKIHRQHAAEASEADMGERHGNDHEITFRSVLNPDERLPGGTRPGRDLRTAGNHGRYR